MRQYRIQTDGTVFRVQRKVCWIWWDSYTYELSIYEHTRIPAIFKDKKDAVEFIYSIQRKKPRSWRTVSWVFP